MNLCAYPVLAPSAISKPTAAQRMPRCHRHGRAEYRPYRCAAVYPDLGELALGRAVTSSHLCGIELDFRRQPRTSATLLRKKGRLARLRC
jgi:hypothetical protein